MSVKVKKTSDDRLFLLKLVSVVILAFAAALTFRRSAGILAMTPVAFLLCGVSAFVTIKPLLKYAVFAVTVFCVNTIEQSDIRVTLTFSALCLLACVLFECGARMYKSKKSVSIAVLSVSLAALILISVFTVGNPFAAYSAGRVIDEYVEETYSCTESTAAGKYSFGKIYYDFASKGYAVDAVSDKYPTEGAPLAVHDGAIKDSFRPVIEEKLCQPYVLEMTDFLRNRFPNDGFEVRCDEIDIKPDESILASQEGDLYGNVVYEITIGGVQTAPQMLKRVEEYISAIDRAEMPYARIIFKSGISQWYRRSVTVDGTRPEFFDVYTLERVHTATTNRFHRYASRFFEIN